MNVGLFILWHNQSSVLVSHFTSSTSDGSGQSGLRRRSSCRRSVLCCQDSQCHIALLLDLVQAEAVLADSARRRSCDAAVEVSACVAHSGPTAFSVAKADMASYWSPCKLALLYGVVRLSRAEEAHRMSAEAVWAADEPADVCDAAATGAVAPKYLAGLDISNGPVVRATAAADEEGGYAARGH